MGTVGFFLGTKQGLSFSVSGSELTDGGQPKGRVQVRWRSHGASSISLQSEATSREQATARHQGLRAPAEPPKTKKLGTPAPSSAIRPAGSASSSSGLRSRRLLCSCHRLNLPCLVAFCLVQRQRHGRRPPWRSLAKKLSRRLCHRLQAGRRRLS